MVSLPRLNLNADWSMSGPFHTIFCRNVMIYFDVPTRQRLLERFGEILAPGGYLFVGLSENLTAVRHGLRYVQPGVYQRP
jgi:chemotaxis protein methyltransferase CheR